MCVYLSLSKFSLRMLSNVSANCIRAASSLWMCLRWSNKDWEEKCTCTDAGCHLCFSVYTIHSFHSVPGSTPHRLSGEIVDPNPVLSLFFFSFFN